MASSEKTGLDGEQEARLRSAARAWLDATERLEHAMQRDTDPAETMDLADMATLARLTFHRALTDLGWTPPRPADRVG